MRWVTKKEKRSRMYYQGNTERTIKRFLFFPTKINGEFRWLEIAEIEQSLEHMGQRLMAQYYRWENQEWK